MPSVDLKEIYKSNIYYNSSMFLAQRTDELFDVSNSIIPKSQFVDTIYNINVSSLESKVTNLLLSFQRRHKPTPEYLAAFSKAEINNIIVTIGTPLLLKNPTLITVEPTAEDTLFFTARFDEKTCYIEVYFEENEAPVCSLNVFENKTIILSRVGAIEEIIKSFSNFKVTATA